MTERGRKYGFRLWPDAAGGFRSPIFCGSGAAVPHVRPARIIPHGTSQNTPKWMEASKFGSILRILFV